VTGADTGRPDPAEVGAVDGHAVAEAAETARRVLAAIHVGELTCSAAHRHRLEGAAMALGAVATEVNPAADST